MVMNPAGVILNPGLDTSKLNDEEIHAKLTDLNSKLSFAYANYGSAGHMIEQLRNLQNILVFEQTERLKKEAGATILANKNKITETEPDLQVHETRKDLMKQENLKSENRKKIIPIITKSWIRDDKNK